MGLRDLRPETAALARAKLGQAGISRREIDRLVASGQLLRLRKGSFVADARLADDDAFTRHRRLIEDVARSVGGAAVVSHQSAAVLLGLSIPPGTNLRAVHLTWPGAAGRGRSTYIRPHRAAMEAEDVAAVAGLAVTSVARTVYDLARSEDQLVSVSVADAALAQGACTGADFEAVLERTRGRPGSVMAWQVMTFADGRAASDLHSKARVVFARLGLPFPELATTIAAAHPLGPIDFEFGEFKLATMVHPRIDLPGSTPDALERGLVGIGWRVCRVSESDLDRPEELFRRMAAALNASRRRWGRRPPMLIGAPKSIWHY